MLLLGWSDPWTTIRYADNHSFFLCLGAHLDGRAYRRIGDGIGDKVGEHLLDQDNIYFYRWKSIRHRGLDRPSFQERVHPIQHITQ
jgi:hypothetical protein